MQPWPSVSIPAFPGSLPPLQLFDTSSRAPRATRATGTASMYVCGITPYDATHLGHAATYLAFDLIYRYWRAQGRDVTYVQNVTDVDDPLLERAARDGVAWQDLAATQIDLFRDDMTALRIAPPQHFVGAVETVGEVADAVEQLVQSGAAYRVDDTDYPDIYFDIDATGHFGYESGYDEPTMLRYSAERGGDPHRPGKRHRLDPMLWRCERPGEPAWDAPIGRGRPGWHIECAVIAVERLGSTIEVQGGGSDLIFPHHECSAAHAEALTGRRPFASHYVHAGMMQLDGEKMSKSLGNLAFVSVLTRERHDPTAIRAALLDGHYRTDRPWSEDGLARAEDRVARWRAAARRVGRFPMGTVDALAGSIADDLDTPSALRALDEWADDASVDGAVVAQAADALLGLSLS